MTGLLLSIVVGFLGGLVVAWWENRQDHRAKQARAQLAIRARETWRGDDAA